MKLTTKNSLKQNNCHAKSLQDINRPKSGLSFKHEPRNFNTLADQMAKEARKDSREYFELENFNLPFPICNDILRSELDYVNITIRHEDGVYLSPVLRFPP